MNICVGPECDRKVHAHGLCLTHSRHRKNGKPLAIIRPFNRAGGTCVGPECERPATITGMCDAHYRQQVRNGTLEPLRKPVEGECTFPECGRRQYSKGLCQSHHRQQRNGGELTTIRVNRTGCDVDGCDATHFGRGLCVKHYRIRFPKKRSTVKAPRPSKPKPAAVKAVPSNLPAGWFETSIKKRSNPAGTQKLTADQIGLPVGVTDDMRRTALRATATNAASRDELATLLSMIFDINTNQKAV